MNYETKIENKCRKSSHLGYDFQLKSLDTKGKFAGYASVFDMVDNHKDIIIRGAFAHTLKGRVRDIKLLWQHQQNEPIGFFTKMFEDSRGLFVEGQLLLEVERAREAYYLLKEGALGGLSIGYTPVKFHIHEKTGIRIISQIDLWEVSLVTFPANNAARITVVKGDYLPPTEIIALSEALDRASFALAH